MYCMYCLDRILRDHASGEGVIVLAPVKCERDLFAFGFPEITRGYLCSLMAVF